MVFGLNRATTSPLRTPALTRPAASARTMLTNWPPVIVEPVRPSIRAGWSGYAAAPAQITSCSGRSLISTSGSGLLKGISVAPPAIHVGLHARLGADRARQYGPTGYVSVVIVVGTSGWQYRDWRGRFYPTGLPQRAWLEYFAQRFASVEVNNAFYRLPERSTFERWRAQTPDDFVVGVKMSRYLTHVLRLRQPAE